MASFGDTQLFHAFSIVDIQKSPDVLDQPVLARLWFFSEKSPVKLLELQVKPLNLPGSVGIEASVPEVQGTSISLETRSWRIAMSCSEWRVAR